MTEPAKQPFEWLIIFLVYNNTFYDIEPQDNKDNSPVENKPKDYSPMEQQTKYILHQIRETNFSTKVKTVFVEAEIKKNRSKKTFATLSILSKKKKGDWLSAVDKLWRRGRPLKILTEAASVKKILLKLKKNFPANKHMIITAGHGSIIGINYYIPKLKPNVNESAQAFIEEKLTGSSFKDSGQLRQPLPEPDPYLLFLANQEISEVLSDVFRDKKVDVMVMYNCLMQNIFTQFDLRETVDWLVAPLSGISIPGFNYGNILNEININPEINAETVSELFINSIRAGNQYSLFKNDIEGTWKVVAMQLGKKRYDLIQSRFHELLKEIEGIRQQYDRETMNCIKTTLRFLFNYGHYCLNSISIPDLGVFLEYFKENIKDGYRNLKSLVTPIENLQVAIKENNRQHLFQGRNFYNNGIGHKEDEEQYKAQISNIAIMFPFRKFISKDLLEVMCDPGNYDQRETPAYKYKIPAFLKDNNYAKLIARLLYPYGPPKA